MADICKDCVYYRPLSWGEPTPCCHYALDNERLRECPAENCKKKLTLEEAMKRLTQEEKQEIIRLRIEGNVPVKAIAEKFHLSKSAVFNIISKWKEHGDSVISDDEKEPDTVAAASDSEQEDLVDVPTDIIPENAEIVKPDDILPCAVVDAVADKIYRLFEKLAECDSRMREIQTTRDNAVSDLKELKAFLKKNGYGDVLKSLTSNAKGEVLNNEN